jgi:hypothetical protein
MLKGAHAHSAATFFKFDIICSYLLRYTHKHYRVLIFTVTAQRQMSISWATALHTHTHTHTGCRGGLTTLLCTVVQCRSHHVHALHA